MSEPTLWATQAGANRVVAVIGVYIAVLALLRLARIARRLYCRGAGSLKSEQTAGVVTSLERLAHLGLAGHFERAVESRDSRGGAEWFSDLEIAQVAFRLYWSRCWADMEAARRASALVGLLSFAAAAVGALHTFRMLCGEYEIHPIYSADKTLFYQMETLAVGLSVSTTLYIGASFFERALVLRRAGWDYFCAEAKRGLSPGHPDDNHT